MLLSVHSHDVFCLVENTNHQAYQEKIERRQHRKKTITHCPEDDASKTTAEMKNITSRLCGGSRSAACKKS